MGLPRRISACLFDLDGVLTDTAQVHAAAWKEMFDSYLRARAERQDAPFVAFDPVADYDTYVDGKPRSDGTRAFLTARGIELPEGDPGDSPDAQTVQALGNRKNDIVLRRIQRDGSRHTRPRSPTCGRYGTRGCDGRWCRQAPTAATC